MQAFHWTAGAGSGGSEKAGPPTAEVAHKYRVSPAWVRRLMQRYRASGQVAPRHRTQYQAPLLAPYRQQLEALIAAQPDATLAELRTALGVSVGLTTVWRAVRRLGLTVKKSPARRRTRSA